MISLSILTGAASLFGAKKAPMVTNVEPVSYTHLDVYKRQTA